MKNPCIVDLGEGWGRGWIRFPYLLLINNLWGCQKTRSYCRIAVTWSDVNGESTGFVRNKWQLLPRVIFAVRINGDLIPALHTVKTDTGSGQTRYKQFFRQSFEQWRRVFGAVCYNAEIFRTQISCVKFFSAVALQRGKISESNIFANLIFFNKSYYDNL